MYANWRPIAMDMLQEYLFNPVRKILSKRIPILAEETRKKKFWTEVFFYIQERVKEAYKMGQMWVFIFAVGFFNGRRKPCRLPIFLSKVDLCPKLWPR